MDVLVLIAAALRLRNPLMDLHDAERDVRLVSRTDFLPLAVQPLRMALPWRWQVVLIRPRQDVSAVADSERYSAWIAADTRLAPWSARHSQRR